MKRSILFFIESMGLGGAEKSLSALLQLIDYTRYDVDLLTVLPSRFEGITIPEQVNRLLIDDVCSRNNLSSKVSGSVYSLLWRCNNLRKKPRHNAEVLWRAVGASYPKLKKHYDVAIAYQQGFPTYFIATKVSADKKLAWINVNLVNANYRVDYNAPFYEAFDRVVTVSEDLHSIIATSGYVNPAKLVTIYDILNARYIRQMAQAADVTDRFTNGGLRIVTVGRISKQKDYPLAVRTAEMLKNRGIKFTWLFVGSGPEYDAVRALITDRGLDDCVLMVGAQPNPYPFMRAADVYVQTSAFEGFGLTVAEAKILGRPVVSTNFDVVHDQIADGMNGLLAEMTPESVAERIMLMIEDSDLRNRIVARVNSEANTTAETEIKKFYKLIEGD